MMGQNTAEGWLLIENKNNLFQIKCFFEKLINTLPVKTRMNSKSMYKIKRD